MKRGLDLTKIVFYQHFGFLAIIVICWLDELLKLPSLLFSDHPWKFVFSRTALNMLIVLSVWLIVSASTRRILKRIRYLEDFLRVCSWCRRINYEGDWIPLEEFMKTGFDTPTTHGICPGCLHQQKEALDKTTHPEQGEQTA
jgi:hypothetical protein